MSDIPPHKPQTLRSIYMYRMIQGNKVRWKFEVDSQMVIINEGPTESQEPAVRKSDVTPGPRPVSVPKDSVDQYKKILEERGIKYSMTASGQVVINEIPNKEKVIMQFFDLNAACPEGLGLETVRDRYKQEYDQAGGAACPACQLNTLQRKYRAILQEKIPNG